MPAYVSENMGKGENGGGMMQDFLLVIIMMAVFIFSWFLMKKTDIFLEECQRAQTGQYETEGLSLRIGFANPLVADSISSALEQYSRQYPDSSVRLFQGHTEVLLKKVSAHKLDIVILPEQADIPSDRKYRRKKVMLAFTPVIMKYGGLPVEPATNGNIAQTLVWMENAGTYAAGHFVKYMENMGTP